MLCYWGAQVREGFGLVKPEQVRHGNWGIKFCPSSAVQDISAGKSCIGFIREGKVSVLRLHNEDADEKLEPLQLQNERIRSIVCGEAGAVLLADDGKVLIMDQSTVCRPLKSLENRQVIQIACGDQHSMALSNDGQLFVWGENTHGQLGLRKEQAGTQSPQHLQSLCEIPVAQISAGGNHSFVLSLSGVVFGWGSNSAGQLGLGDTKDRFVPTIVKSLCGKKTVSISCGGEHTATLSKGGTVFTFGSGGFGQLGHNSLKDEHHPRLIAELWGSKVSQVTCGRHHTLVFEESSKLIYSFGCGMQGQLGNGEQVKQSVPLPVLLPTECTEFTMEKLITGEHHSFALFFKNPGNESEKPKSGSNGGILTLNDRMIDRWVSESDPWPTVKNEINTVFSSAASLNGSFLKTSRDEHYQTSVEHCGLDFDLVKTSFAKLFASKSLISEVVQQTLLPSLNPNPTGVEALRLYLLLPELINGLKKQRTKLIEALASKILELNSAARKVLEMYWSRLPDDWFERLIKLFHKESTDLIDQICDETDHQSTRHLKNILEILQMAYQISCSTDITHHDFIIHKINDLLDLLQTITADLLRMELYMQINEDFHDMVKLEEYYFRTVKILVKFPFASDFITKQRMFNLLQEECFRNVPNLAMGNSFSNLLHINRESVLTDTLQYLRQNTHSFMHPLQVAFIGEDGIDMRGLSAEFFSLISKSFIEWDKKILEVHESSLVWFNPHHTRGNKNFYYLGVICGMALYNRHHINIDFPLALFKKLLQQKPSLDDLEELSPVEARSLKNLLEEDEEEVVNLQHLDFTCKGQELVPNGSQIQVNKVNRQKYVDLYVDLEFNKSVKTQFEQFTRGFSKGCPLDAWTMFHPEELQELLHGSPQYNWKELQQSASYEGCSASDELIKNFWTVFFELSEENKKKFLMFLYGTERVPAGGLSKRALKISQTDCPDPDDHLPEAQTCFERLVLPKYSDINTLHDKLIHAINSCAVFGRG
ncbi:E3 ISG15--protein ligase HERC5.4 [Danio rerio]|uniref:E3 ISG15--protein ligase HERC5.4 n=1 Tax=Danio rerio TaxID=7955 RepID=B8A4S7_DANRE|nr:E3 ISG15--protein ligase HERC5.4 [Danio rerio]|eukprot:NP_001139103.1 probable E3 ubiquitin-protein ligase HERC4-like [Danio rerio]